MITFKDWNVKHLGDMLLLGVVLILIVTLMHMVVSPLLTTVLPTVFIAKLTLTDILLFLILVRLALR